MTTRTLAMAAAFVLAAAGTQASAAEGLSPEVLLPGLEKTDAHNPVIAAGKDGYLVVWEAGRNEKADIVAMRLDKTGKALDAQPLVVSNAKDCQQRPKVAWGNGVFLVVWSDLRNGKDFDIYAARVSPEGKVLDPDGIAVARGARHQCDPAVAFASGSFQILWREYVGDAGVEITTATMPPPAKYQIIAARVSADAKLVDAEPQVIFANKDWNMAPPTVLALADGRVLVASGYSVWGLKMGLKLVKDGKPDGAGLALDRKICNTEISLATDGKGVLVSWTTFEEMGGRGGGAPGSGLATFGIEGSSIKLVSDGKAPYTSSNRYGNAPWGAHPSVVWDGTTYVLAWDVFNRSKDTLFETVPARRIKADGELVEPALDVAGELESPACRPAADSDGAGTTVIVYERHPKTADVPIKVGVRVLMSK